MGLASLLISQIEIDKNDLILAELYTRKAIIAHPSKAIAHANMGVESDNFFIQDLLECKKWFIDEIGFKPYIYAFPNGSYKQSQINLAKRYGYTTLLLVDNDFSFTYSDIHSRFCFHAISEKEMRYKATGYSKLI